jgi:HEAT repeat protein
MLADPLLATRWIHPLLIQKGAQDPELKNRVDAMLARIGQTKLSSLYESEIRSLGAYCVLPLIRYLESPQSQADPARRQTAARIIADLATTWAIGDLIGLLKSEDGIVRRHAAAALQRLTEETHGTTPEQWQENLHPETLEAWKAWWSENHRLYPTLDELQQQEVKENTL